MADFLVIRDFQSTSFRIKAGDVIDDANYPVSQLQASGLLSIDLTPPMLVVISQFKEARQAEELTGGDLLGALIFAGLVSLPMEGLAQRVVVESVSDLPTPSGGNHTLAADTVYQFNGVVTSADGLLKPSTTVIIGTSPGRDIFVYTGTGTAITVLPGAGTLPTIRGLGIIAATGLAIDVQATANFVLDGCVIQASQIATIEVVNGIVITACQFTGFGQGITFAGTPLRLSMDTVTMLQTTGGSGNVCLDFGTAVFDSVLMSVIRCEVAVGGVGVEGLPATGTTGVAASPNIAVGGVGKMIESFINGAGTALSGITNEDIRWEFHEVGSIEDTVDLGDIFIPPGNTTETTISDQGATGDTVGWVRIAGTTTPVFESRLEETANNELTYRGEDTKKLTTTYCVAIRMASGGTGDLQVGVGVNGTIDPNTAVPVSPSSSQERTVTCQFVRSFSTADTVEPMVRNLGNTTNVVAFSTHFVVKN